MTHQSLPPHIATLPTPRSDAASNKSLFSGPALEHSRQLERELLWAMEVIEKLALALSDSTTTVKAYAKEDWTIEEAGNAKNAYTNFKQYMEERR